MCLGIPMKIVHMEETAGIVENKGIKLKVELVLIDNPRIGDWVIVHAGFAITKLTEQEAQETLELLKEENFIE
jgi:hydrogenase expression/formation protein HypC